MADHQVATYMTAIARHRFFVQLPEEVAAGIDRLVGARQRSAFVIEQLRHELKRRQQIAALNAVAGTWNDVDHPELAEGGAAYVEKLRAADRSAEATRMEQLISNQNPG